MAATLIAAAVSAPWTAALTMSEHTLIEYFLLLAALALFVGFVRAWTTRGEVGSRYRTAVVARLGIMSAASLSYAVLIYEFATSYSLHNGMYLPNSNAILAFEPRYVEWSVTVPLLVIELLAICVVAGAKARRVRAIAAGSTFLMIFCGFLGVFVVGDGTSTLALVVFGLLSAIFWVVSNVVLVRAVQQSLGELTPEAATVLRAATFLLLCGWIIYPIVYLIQIVSSGGVWVTVIQVTLCVADIAVKLGFSGLVHRAAKLRTAEDVRAGDDIHPESIWISSVKQSDAGIPHEVYLAPGASIHPPRQMPATQSAVATEALPIDPENV